MSEVKQTPDKGTLPAAEPVKPAVDYREKFSHSTRENQIISAERDKLKERVNDLTTEQPPTEEEMRQIYGDEWEYMTDEVKNSSIRQETQSRKIARIHNEVLELKEEKMWQADLANAVENHPDLKGREAEFRKYVYRYPKSVPIDTLAKSFLFEIKENEPPASALAPAEPETEIVFERGGSGNQTPPKVQRKVYTEDEAKQLRTTNPQLYNELVKKRELIIEGEE